MSKWKQFRAVATRFDKRDYVKSRHLAPTADGRYRDGRHQCSGAHLLVAATWSPP